MTPIISGRMAASPQKTAMRLLSRVPGRERWALPLLKDNDDLALSLKMLLASEVGFTNVSVSTLTGRLLVEYSPNEIREPVEAVLAALAREPGIDQYPDVRDVMRHFVQKDRYRGRNARVMIDRKRYSNRNTIEKTVNRSAEQYVCDHRPSGLIVTFMGMMEMAFVPGHRASLCC